MNSLAYVGDRENAPKFKVDSIKTLKSVAGITGTDLPENMNKESIAREALKDTGFRSTLKKSRAKDIAEWRAQGENEKHKLFTDVLHEAPLFTEGSWINYTLKAFLEANPSVKYITIFTTEPEVELKRGEENHVDGNLCNLLAIDINKYRNLFADVVIKAEGKDKTDETSNYVKNALFGLDCPVLIEPYMTGIKLPFISKEHWSEEDKEEPTINLGDDREIDIEAYMAMDDTSLKVNRSSEYAMLLDENYRFIAYTLDNGVLNEMTPIMQQITGMMHYTLTAKLAHWGSWTIDIRKSILSKLEATEVSLPKEVFLKSKMLRDGVHFIFTRDVKNYPKQHIHIWLDESDTLIVTQNSSNNNEINPEISLHPFYFSMKNLPDKITEKSMKRALKTEKDTFIVESESELQENRDNGLVYEAWLGYQATHRGFGFLHGDDTSTGVVELTQGNPDEKFSLDFSEMVWDSLKLLVAYSSPELRNQIRKVKGERTFKNPRTGKGETITYKKWVWGTNKQVYVYPKKKKGKKKGTWFSRPSLAKYYITNLQKYLDLGYDVEEEPEPVNGRNHSIIRWREGSWKGNKEKFYFAGNISGPYSRKAMAWLNRIEKEQGIILEHAERNKELRIDLGNGNYYLADGYCRKNNTIYEFNGDFWHGNPAKYEPEDINPKNGKTFGELHMKTIVKENVLKSMGFNVVSIWEEEFDKEVRK